MMNLKRKKKGFTLVELMAVIAIIAILAAVLVPTVSGYIERSKKTAIITQVRNVVNAVEVYNSTAPEADKITNETINQLIDSTDADAVTAFINQKLLTSNDVTKLSLTIPYTTLKAINEDENAMNNIYKNASGKFEYESDIITTPVQIEPEDQQDDSGKGDA